MSKTAVVQAQQRWEYLCLARKSETYLATELNLLGQEGWELVSTQWARDTKGAVAWIAFLKRPSAGSTPVDQASVAPATRSEEKHEPVKEKDQAGFDLKGDVFEIKKE